MADAPTRATMVMTKNDTEMSLDARSPSSEKFTHSSGESSRHPCHVNPNKTDAKDTVKANTVPMSI
eukprot:scaffold17707_cov212-Amphora_coffeaeformis.AAC.2